MNMKALPWCLLLTTAVLLPGFEMLAQVPLAITIEGDGVRLSWTSSAAYYDLQSSETLSPDLWTAAGEEVLLDAGRYTALVETEASARFFRLASRDPFLGSWLKEFESDDNISDGVVIQTVPHEFRVAPTASPDDFVITIMDFDTDLPVTLAGNTLVNQAGPIEFSDWRMLNVLFMSDGVNKVFATVGQEHSNPLDVSFGATCWTEAKGSLTASDLVGTWLLRGYSDPNLRNTGDDFTPEEATATITAVSPTRILVTSPGLTRTATLSGMEATFDDVPGEVGGGMWHTQRMVSDGLGVAVYFVVAELDDPSDISLTVLLGSRLDEPEPVPGMVWIPPGTFMMGSPASEAGRWDDEGPQTQVTLTQGFWLGKYEVTQAEYQAVRGGKPVQLEGG